MKTKFTLAAILLGFAFATSSCKKDNETDTAFKADQQVTKDQNQADHEAEDVSALQDDLMAANEAKLSGRMAVNDTTYTFPFDSCATVTIIPKGSNATGKVTVDYGSGCQGRDGRYRKGIISWTFTDRLRKPGAVIITSFLNYGVKRINSEAYVMVDNASTKITTNMSSNEPVGGNTTIQLKREVGMKLIFSDNTTFTYLGTKNLVWDLGALGYRWDNVYTLKAGSNLTGIDRQGREYTMTVNNDVVRKASCALAGIFKPVSGKVTITNNTKTKVVDFGDGTCDNTVTISINGKATRTRW